MVCPLQHNQSRFLLEISGEGDSMKQKKKIKLTVDPSVFSYEVLEDSPLPYEVCCVGIDTLSQAKRGI